MKNFFLSLMVLTTLSINLAPAQAVNRQAEVSTNNELYSQGNKLTNSTNVDCYWVGFWRCK
ncbi:MAG: hypothetical protein QNJ34_24680 [Xenococcaceae cyanobacterium MO_188.B29]|nr:hypothetical protein [Xenococcaceae cyanobacterium MO_188.B29]